MLQNIKSFLLRTIFAAGLLPLLAILIAGGIALIYIIVLLLGLAAFAVVGYNILFK